MDIKINLENNPNILNEFLLYLMNVKNYSIRTIQEYKLDLKIFLKFILIYKEINIEFKEITIFTILQINHEDILAFLVYMNYKKNNCSSTRNRRIASIKSFFKWLYVQNPAIKKENPAINIHKATCHYRLPKYLTLEEAKKIQNIFNENNSKNYIRNNCIIHLFLSTGIRLSELINIDIANIDFDNKTIRVWGKGNKQRTVCISEYCKNMLLEYLNTRKIDNNLNQPLFISSQNKRISKSSIEYICQKAYKLMGLEDKEYTVHTLRHTAATIVYRHANNDILVVKEFLGHTSLVATEIYTHIHNNDLKEAMERHPLNIS